jgi:uncharacterized RDD family membrane protein YckC
MAVQSTLSGNQYAGFWVRFSASLWDNIIIGLPALIIQLLLTYMTGIDSMYYLVTLGLIVLTVYLEGAKGGTPGKWIIGIKIVNDKNQFIGIPGAMLRYLGRIVCGLTLGIGYIMIGTNPQKRGLHDQIANTFVIKSEKFRSWAVALGIVLGLLYWLILVIAYIAFVAYLVVKNTAAL